MIAKYAAPQNTSEMMTRSKSRLPKGWKRLATAAAVCLWMLAHGCFASDLKSDDLHLAVEFTTGERSKDSSSETTTIAVERHAIVWERTFTGRGSRDVPPVRKELRLADADEKGLLQLIRTNHLFVTDALALPQGTPNVYFNLSIALTMDGKKETIAISGPRKSGVMREDPLYKKTQVLLKELYRIIHAQDSSVRFEELAKP